MKILLMGYYGVGNLGDEMMLFCLREWLTGQGASITVLCAKPEEVHRRYGLPAVEDVPLLGERSWKHAWGRGVALRVLRAIAMHDALAIGGGDLIRDDRGWRQFLTVIEKAVVARLLGKEIYLLNIGLGTPCTWYGRMLLGWVLRRAKRIIVRDQRSIEVCQALGAGATAVYAPDIVFRLPAMVEKRPPPINEPYALVCLRGTANVFHRYELTEARLRTLSAGLDALVERHGLRIVFLPFHVSSAGEDESLHRRIAHRMWNQAAFVMPDADSNLSNIGSWFAGCRCVLAMRLHAAVLATAYGKPCLLMPYDQKVIEFGKQFPVVRMASAELLDDRDGFASMLERAATSPVTADPESGEFWNTARLFDS